MIDRACEPSRKGGIGAVHRHHREIAMTRKGYWQDLTTRDFAQVDAERTIALLPVAAVEQHGPHLPLATDAIINDGLVTALLERTQTQLLVLPAQNIGHSLEHIDFPGTLTFAAETLLATWTELGRSVARAGIRKLIVFNTHGGQTSLVQLAALRLRHECKMLVVRANYFALGTPPGLFDAEEVRHGIHGGEMETSLMLHLRPDLVRIDALANFAALTHDMNTSNRFLGPEKPIGFGWLSQDLHPSGACGNAAQADAARGAQLMEYLVAALDGLLEEVAATTLETLKS
jgi:creatinine amidohydrolase